MAKIEDRPEDAPKPFPYGRFDPEDVFTACQTGDVAFVRALIALPELKLDIVDGGWADFTPLHHAAAHNARDVVVELIRSGRVDASRRDALGRTAATLAYEVANNPALGRYLLRKEYEQKEYGGPHGPSVVTFPSKKG